MTEVAASEASPSHPTLDIAAAGVLAPIRSAIDASMRSFVVGLFLSATVWLLFSTFLAAIAAVKLEHPGFLNFSFLTYGRLAPAAENGFIFGWCGTAAMGVGAWVVARLSGRVAPAQSLAAFGAVLWNGGVLVGILGSLGGWLRPLNGLEFPAAAYFLMSLGLISVTAWVLLSFQDDVTPPIASMFVVAGFLWLGLSLLAGNILLVTNSVSGVSQQIVAAWSFGAVTHLFLVPVALGAAFFVVPKASGAPIVSGSFARAMFWFYFLLAGFAVVAKVPSDLLPGWLAASAASASILLLIPIGGLVYVLFATAFRSSQAGGSPSLRFISFGCGALLISAALMAVSALRSVDLLVHFTLFDVGVRAALLHIAVTMCLFGAIYYMMPRLSSCEWLSSSLISFHFLGAAYGSCMAAGMLLLSGAASGDAILEGGSSFTQVMEIGSSYYWGHSVSFILVLAGYAAFALHFLLMALRIGQPAGEPTLLRGGNAH